MAVVPSPDYPRVQDVLEVALADSGVVALGQQPSADQLNKAFLRYCWMLDMWNVKRFSSWHLQDLAYQIAVSQEYYTVGPGGNFPYSDGQDWNGTDFSTDFITNARVRPPRIEAAYARLNYLTPTAMCDFPLARFPSYEDYSRVRLKSQTNFPTHYFYDPSLPQGKVYFWPLPLPTQFEMHILVPQPLYKPQTPADIIAFPPEYIPALELNLTMWIRSAFKLPPDPQLSMMAKAALNAIKVNNTQIPELTMPAGLARGRRRYNIFSDEP